jgi:hypothetical protein
VVLKQRDSGRQVFLQPTNAGCGEGDGLEMEVPGEFRLPLVNEVGRAKNREASDLTAVVKLANNQAGLDGFADTGVVSHQEANRRLAQRHEQRHELVGTRLDGDVGKRAKGPGTGAKL